MEPSASDSQTTMRGRPRSKVLVPMLWFVNVFMLAFALSGSASYWRQSGFRWTSAASQIWTSGTGDGSSERPAASVLDEIAVASDSAPSEQGSSIDSGYFSIDSWWPKGGEFSVSRWLCGEREQVVVVGTDVGSSTPAVVAHGGSTNGYQLTVEAAEENITEGGRESLQCPEQETSLENCTNLLARETRTRLGEILQNSFDSGSLPSILNGTTPEVLQFLESLPSDGFYAGLAHLVILHPAQFSTLVLGLLTTGWLSGLIGAMTVLRLKRRTTGRSPNAKHS